MIELGKLTTLRAVVAHGSFSAAGDAIGLTQPAVSRQVSLLERQVGTQLVRRTQQGVLPTEAGRVLVAHALNVIIAPDQVVAVPLAGGAPVRRVQAAIMREQRAPLARAALDALREVGRRRSGPRAG